MSRDLASLAVIAAIAAAAPLLVHRFRLFVPEIVVLLLGGVVCGPQLLGWIQVSEPVSLFNEVGLGLLFFIAGYEVDLRRMPALALRLGGIGWLVSVALAGAVTLALSAAGIVSDVAAVAIALTSTALGTLLPVLDSKGLLPTGFGRLFFGAGFFGEFGPILAIAILLGTSSRFFSLITLAVFGVFVAVVALLPSRLASDPLQRALAFTSRTNSLTGVRLALLLLFVLLALAAGFGLDAVLGAFAAGAVLRLYSPERNEHLMSRIEAVGFGLFIPLFFVITGATLDVDSIVTEPLSVVLFVLLLVLVRGLPQLLVYRRAIPDLRDRAAFSFYSATGLPILIAVTAVSVGQGIMTTRSAAILIGAGVLTVIAFPISADALLRGRTPRLPDEVLLTASLPEPEAAPGG